VTCISEGDKAKNGKRVAYLLRESYQGSRKRKEKTGARRRE